MSEETGPQGFVESASRTHRRLVARLGATHREDPAAVLNLAVAVLVHAELERCAVFGRARYVSPELERVLEGEHAALVEDVALMEELAAGRGDPGDLESLCAALYDKVVEHVERDERVIYGSLARLGALPAAEASQ